MELQLILAMLAAAILVTAIQMTTEPRREKAPVRVTRRDASAHRKSTLY